MGNLFCKQTSIPATSDLSTAIDPTGTNFLQILCTFIWDTMTKPDGAIQIHSLWPLMFLKGYAIESVLLGMAKVDLDDFEDFDDGGLGKFV